MFCGLWYISVEAGEPQGSFLHFAGYIAHSTRENDINIKRFAAAAVLAAAVAGVSAGPALAAPADQEPAVAVAAPLNPISATLQKFIAGLSFIGGQELPGCTIPTGC